MNINKVNYGQFIVDYYDGQLSPEEEQRLLRFLEQHPTLKKEFENFEEVPVLPEEPLAFPEKQALKRPEIVTFGGISEDNYTEFFVLSQDGELDAERQQSLEAFLQYNPHLQEEYRQFGMAKVAPDESVVFENKQLLYQRRPIPLIRYAGMAVAAMLLLFLGFRFFLSTPGQKTESKRFALETIPMKTTRITIAETSSRLKWKRISVSPDNAQVVKKKVPVTKYKPVAMMASADVYRPLRTKKDYAPLLFPKGKAQKEVMALSSPVVVSPPKQHRILPHTLGEPVTRLATLFTLKKMKKKQTGTHDKDFVKILQTGVDALNMLTDNDVVMVKTYNAKGNLIDYQLLSDNFSINRPVKEK